MSELPIEQVEALQTAANEIVASPPVSILPENHVTRSDITTSHHIGQEYIVRLRHAGQTAGLPNNLQIWLGGVFGAASGGVAGLIEYFNGAPPLGISHFINVIVLAVCCAGAFALFQRGDDKETVKSICDEIENRKKAKA